MGHESHDYCLSILSTDLPNYLISNFREPQNVLDISHFLFYSLLFFYYKVLVYYLLHLGWWRKLYFYCVVELAQEYILDFLLEHTIAWGFCTMVPGNKFFFFFVLFYSSVPHFDNCSYLKFVYALTFISKIKKTKKKNKKRCSHLGCKNLE